MPYDEDRKPDEPYCSKRADNDERWSFIRENIDDDHQTLLDIGCAEGYFTNAAALYGLEVSAIEGNEGRYRYAESTYGDHDDIQIQLNQVTPENIQNLPATDVTLLLTIQHHWVGAFGVEKATQMLKIVAQKTDLLCYEPPGTMFLSNENPIHPDESIDRYRDYLKEIFDSSATIVDVEMFSHVNEGEYSDRRDPLFVINTAII